MNSLEEWLDEVEKRESYGSPLDRDHAITLNLLALVRRYREALEQIGASTKSYNIAKAALDALHFDPRQSK